MVKEYCVVEESSARVMMASLNRYFINYYKREKGRVISLRLGKIMRFGVGLVFDINNKMASGSNVAFQSQNHEHLFDQSSNMQDSSVREESIKNLTFRSNSK